MRKSRRQYKRKIGKRFSRKKILDSRNKFLKGGSFGDDDNFVFIGYKSITGTQFNQSSHAPPPVRVISKDGIPLIVPKQIFYPSQGIKSITTSLEEVIEPSNIVPNVQTSGYVTLLILPYLYELPNVRNIDLLRLLRKGCSLADENCNVIIPGWQLTAFNVSDIGNYYNNKHNEIMTKYKPQVTEIERKYPGLFKPIFLTPEETQEAVKRVEAETPILPKEVQMEERIGDKLTNAVSDIVDVIKSSVESGVNENYDLISSLRNEVRQLQSQLAQIKN